MRKLSSFFVIALCLALIWLLRPAPIPGTGFDEPPAQATDAPGVVVFDLVDNASDAEIEAFEARYGIDVEYSSDVSQDEALVRATVPDARAVLQAVAGDPLVEVAEPEVRFEATGFPNDPMWDKQWNMRLIDAPAGWRAGSGRGVKVAVLDTGVSVVEDLPEARVVGGKSFIRGAKTPADDHGHGTHVAGTIAQATNNAAGVAGVAPEVTIVPYKVLNGMGFGSSDGIAAAVDEAVDQGAQVINLSLGGGHSAVLHKAVNEAVARGVVVVAAAGNTGRRGVGCPGHAEDVIGVSAVGPDDTRAFYSTYGPGVEIAAPGGDTRQADGGVLQDTIDGKGGHAYRAFQGTSMATPHVAGAAAVLIGMGLDAEAATTALYATAVDRGDPGFDEVYGHGRLDLGAAVRWVGTRHNGLLFGLGGLMGLALSLLAGLRLRSSLGVGAVAAVTAGGLFFLPWLGLPPNALLELLSRDLISWPGFILGAEWTHFPLWLSALVPTFLAFLLGPSRLLGGVAAGVCVGMAAGLCFGAAAGTLEPWWFGDLMGRAWLAVNGVGALMSALGVVGMQKMRQDGML
ncbi:MAG: S8 family serine peptidase [Alphaproteobacteria bacterium]|nr:S8 family serine peptidase [Alphaproteobacteria bacterium]